MRISNTKNYVIPAVKCHLIIGIPGIQCIFNRVRKLTMFAQKRTNFHRYRSAWKTVEFFFNLFLSYHSFVAREG